MSEVYRIDEAPVARQTYRAHAALQLRRHQPVAYRAWKYEAVPKGVIDATGPSDPRSRLSRAAVRALTELDKKVVTAERLLGGTIAATFRIGFTDGTTAVLKQSRRAPVDAWEIEADGLEGLRVEGGPEVPAVIAVGEDFLVIEDLGTEVPDTEDFWATFGHKLACLHATVGDRFGWHRQNLLGLIPQDNTWSDDGWEFFGEQRLVRYLRLPNVEAALTADDRAAIEQIAGRLPEMVPEQPPSLVHGDLWRSNVLAAGPKRPALCDPAVSYAWAEIDLSMLWCSGGVPRRCFDAYQEVRPFESGWQERFPLLQIREHLSVLAHIGPDTATSELIRDAIAPFR